jgi:hypothetical protein
MSKASGKLAKKQLLRTVRKATKPKKGFDQWVLTIERRKLTPDVGLFRVEAEFNGRPEWSGSVSVTLPEAKRFGPDGAELPSEWDQLAVGASAFNVLTAEVRGRTIVETAMGWIKRTFEEGSAKDVFPFLRR